MSKAFGEEGSLDEDKIYIYECKSKVRVDGRGWMI